MTELHEIIDGRKIHFTPIKKKKKKKVVHLATETFTADDMNKSFGHDPPVTEEEFLESVREVKKTEAEIAARASARSVQFNKHEYHDKLHKPRLRFHMSKILRDGDDNLRTYAYKNNLLFAHDTRVAWKSFIERIKETPFRKLKTNQTWKEEGWFATSPLSPKKYKPSENPMQNTTPPIPLFPHIAQDRLLRKGKINLKPRIKLVAIRSKKPSRVKNRRQKNQTKKKKNEHGARLILNNSEPHKATTNIRTCLLYAVMSIIPKSKMDRDKLSSDIIDAMPTVGDTSVKDIQSALSNNSLRLNNVSRRYHKRDCAPLDLMNEESCSLLISLLLTNTNGKVMSHFVSWDGDVIFDNPFKIKVSRRIDCVSMKSSKEVFMKLYPEKEFKSWQICSIYSLELSP